MISYSIPSLNIYGKFFDQFRSIIYIFPCYFAHNYPLYAILIGATGGGNCLYNSCSVALVRDEILSCCLRYLTCIELYLHASYYAAHPVIKECHRKGAFLNESTALSAALSYFAADSCSVVNKICAIEIEAIET